MPRKKRVTKQEQINQKIEQRKFDITNENEKNKRIRERKLKQRKLDRTSNFSKYWKGKTFSKDHKENLSIAQLKYRSNMSEEDKIKRNQSLSIAREFSKNTKDTKPELLFEELLKERNIEYLKQYQIGYCHVDFFLPKQNCVIEIFGCYSHCCIECGFNDNSYGVSAFDVRLRDEKRIQYLISFKYDVKIIWQHQLN